MIITALLLYSKIILKKKMFSRKHILLNSVIFLYAFFLLAKVIVIVILLIPPFTLGGLFFLDEQMGKETVKLNTINKLYNIYVESKPIGAYDSGCSRLEIYKKPKYFPIIAKSIYYNSSSSLFCSNFNQTEVEKYIREDNNKIIINNAEFEF
ncbi:MAG: hypothetical protein WCJ58_08750 [bacterium]